MVSVLKPNDRVVRIGLSRSIILVISAVTITIFGTIYQEDIQDSSKRDRLVFLTHGEKGEGRIACGISIVIHVTTIVGIT